MTRVGVVGAGSWGTALASVLAKKGHDVHLWALESEVVDDIRRSRENKTYLPGSCLPANLQATGDLGEALAEAEFVISVAPSQFVGNVMADAAQYIREDALIVSASKGIEIATLRRMDEVMKSVFSPAHMEGLCVPIDEYCLKTESPTGAPQHWPIQGTAPETRYRRCRPCPASGQKAHRRCYPDSCACEHASR